MRRLLLTALLLPWLPALPLAAQAPRVTALTAVLQGDSLFADVQVAGLFSPKIVNTIRSGLPAVVRLDFRVLNEHNREVTRALPVMEIKYDIWAQRYDVVLNHHRRSGGSFEEMEKICSTLTRLPLATLAGLPAGRTCRVRLQVTVIPISTRQNHQWRERIESADLQETSAPSESGRSGFSVNVSRLLSFFLGGQERVHGASAWATSPPLPLARTP
ncbi:MAG: DUF4390 domain-containing protein [candidate division KSB1 bacterium]|nr:DUF4390 domain-containing protein [candidate division KSB1 bacterium]MDZ7274686.1 DUF4390 domain-containing protein [candidate division KSB1 bacterium]MDZ7285511.1 DUF4390 domain-containing protein [candidate division KSB1 bacterium]MDZ7298543.1 DUF4390 domain-containing protein [candidate division KSB1 bacterium]MDZ7306605.1 DUF4390 domain-containing protein [candidate division KSB1 bacterium]